MYLSIASCSEAIKLSRKKCRRRTNEERTVTCVCRDSCTCHFISILKREEMIEVRVSARNDAIDVSRECSIIQSISLHLSRKVTLRVLLSTCHLREICKSVFQPIRPRIERVECRFFVRSRKSIFLPVNKKANSPVCLCRQSTLSLAPTIRDYQS